MSKQICSEEHIAYPLAAAMQAQRRCVGSMRLRDEQYLPFFWLDQWGERRELRQDTFRETGQMLLDQNLEAV